VIPPETVTGSDTATAARTTQPLTPGQIRSAYALPSRGARGQTIAIVTAYDNPYAASDLAAYAKRYGVPACTAASGCFRKLNQTGHSSPLPVLDPTGGNWITEAALGVEIARGVCQSCSIMLVEADTTAKSDFSKAVDAAGKAGATVIATTFTATEDPLDSQYLNDYHQAKAPVLTAVGEPASGYGYSGSVSFPSSLPDVLAVGGTHLDLARGGGYGTEQAWMETMSGCSLYQSAPPWQVQDATALNCGARRAVADLAAMADPGALVRITGAGAPGGPWYVATGTSLSVPIVGATIGLAGSLGSGEAQMLYARARTDPGAFHDVSGGVNAPGCIDPICHSGRGFDGPTGLGTPFGLAAFLPSGGALAPRHPQLTVLAPGGALRTGPRFSTHLSLRNGNAFALTGALTLERTLRVGGRFRLVKFATAKLAIAPLGTAAKTLTVPPRYRKLLKGLGSVVAYLQLRVHGPAGPTATVTRKLRLYAP
jgi:hypothetical protein